MDQNFNFNFNSRDNTSPTLEQIRQALLETGSSASALDQIAAASGRNAEQLSKQERALVALVEWYKKAQTAAEQYRAAAEAASRGVTLPGGGGGGLVPPGGGGWGSAGSSPHGLPPPFGGNVNTGIPPTPYYRSMDPWEASQFDRVQNDLNRPSYSSMSAAEAADFDRVQNDYNRAPYRSMSAAEGRDFDRMGSEWGESIGPPGRPPGWTSTNEVLGPEGPPPQWAGLQQSKPIGKGKGGIGGGLGLVGNFMEVQGIYMGEQALQAVTAEMVKSIDVAATYEDRWLAISNTMGSLDKGKAQLEATRQAAFDTATSFDAMAQGEQRLMNAGMSAERTIPTLTALSAISKANGASQDQYNNALNAYAQIQEKGTLQSEEAVRQLSNRYIPAIQLYAQANNETTQQVISDMKAGKISADEFFDSINKIAMTKFGASLKESTESWHGIMTNMGNAVNQLETAFGTTAMQGALPGMKDLLNTLRDPNVIKGAEALGNFFGAFVSLTAKSVSGWSEELGRWVSDIKFLTAGPITDLIFGSDKKAKQDQADRLQTGVGEGLNFDDAKGATLDYRMAIDQLTASEDMLRHAQEMEQRTLDDKIKALQDQNAELDKQRTLQEKLRGMATDEHDLNQAKMDAVNIYTSYGRGQAAKVGGLEDKVVNDRQDLLDMLAKGGNDAKIAAYQAQKEAGQRTLQDQIYNMDQTKTALNQYGADVPVGSDLYNQYRAINPDLHVGSAQQYQQQSIYDLQAPPVTNTGATYNAMNHPLGGYLDRSSGTPILKAYCPSCMAQYMLTDPRFVQGLAGQMYTNSAQNR